MILIGDKRYLIPHLLVRERIELSKIPFTAGHIAILSSYFNPIKGFNLGLICPNQVVKYNYTEKYFNPRLKYLN